MAWAAAAAATTMRRGLATGRCLRLWRHMHDGRAVLSRSQHQMSRQAPRSNLAISWAAPMSTTTSAGQAFDSRDHRHRLLASAAVAAAGLASGTLLLQSDEAQCESRSIGGSGRHNVCKMVLHQDYRMLEAALKNGADPNERSRFGWCAVHMAAFGGDTEALRILLEAGADVNAKDFFGTDGYRASHLMARVTEFSPTPIDPMADTTGFTALHYAVAADRRAAIDLLQDHGADPRIQDEQGRTAIDFCQDARLRKVLQSYADEFEQRQKEKERRKELEARRLRKMFPLEARLKKFIVGQESALASVAAAIRRKENGWHDEDRPLVFLFLGSSGLGKTEVAKRIADYMHEGDKKAFVRFDMSEYQTKHESAKLIGSPPGYVGFEDGGQLTKQLAKTPNAVVLFDEIEKSHPDVLTVLLQLFDEGRLTSGQGETVDCKGAIFVMTSNLASDEIADYAAFVREADGTDDVVFSKDFKDDVVFPILKSSFQRNEFIGRIKEIVFFTPFSPKELRQLVQLQLTKWADRAKERHDIELTWDDAVLEVLAKEYQVYYGARSLQHAVDHEIINHLAQLFEDEKLTPGGHAHVAVDKEGKIQVSCRAGESKGWLTSLMGGSGRS